MAYLRTHPNPEPLSKGLEEEWDKWLNANFDPGHYDSYKERDQNVLPYVDGKPQWVTDTYIPEHLYVRYIEEKENRT